MVLIASASPNPPDKNVIISQTDCRAESTGWIAAANSCTAPTPAMTRDVRRVQASPRISTRPVVPPSPRSSESSRNLLRAVSPPSTVRLIWSNAAATPATARVTPAKARTTGPQDVIVAAATITATTPRPMSTPFKRSVSWIISDIFWIMRRAGSSNSDIFSAIFPRTGSTRAVISRLNRSHLRVTARTLAACSRTMRESSVVGPIARVSAALRSWISSVPKAKTSAILVPESDMSSSITRDLSLADVILPRCVVNNDMSPSVSSILSRSSAMEIPIISNTSACSVPPWRASCPLS